MLQDQELEEFKRLEKLIRREVGESVSSLPDTQTHSGAQHTVCLGRLVLYVSCSVALKDGMEQMTPHSCYC